MITRSPTLLLRGCLAGVLANTLLLAVFVFVQEASSVQETSLPAKFRGEYENLKARAVKLMEDVERARVRPGSVDSEALSEVARASSNLSLEVKMYLSTRDIEFHQAGSDPLLQEGNPRVSERSGLLGIYYACQAIEKVLLAELDYQTSPHPKPDFVLRIQEKYKEEWKFADQVVSRSGFGN